MASAGKRRGAGERVLESRHVIGLFMLMLLFSGVFFTLGFVMGRNQYDGQVRASSTTPQVGVSPKLSAGNKAAKNSPAATAPAEPAAAPNSEWEFYNAGKSQPAEDRLKPAAPTARNVPVAMKNTSAVKSAGSGSKSLNAPLLPGGSYTLQVAALTREADALDLATRLQKKKFAAFVLSPQGDKYYRVQVGPYADQKAADAAKKGLEDAGFKALVKH